MVQKLRVLGGPANGRRVFLPDDHTYWEFRKASPLPAYGTQIDIIHSNHGFEKRTVYMVKDFRLPSGTIKYLGLRDTSVEDDLRKILLP